jgi:hypothetical protein
MIISTDTLKIKDANKFGELLREYFFTKDKGRGCYENFELEPFMVRGEVAPYIQSLFGDCDSTVHFYANRNNLNQWCAYMWDGDGTLIVSDGERVAVNGDCKKRL